MTKSELTPLQLRKVKSIKMFFRKLFSMAKNNKVKINRVVDTEHGVYYFEFYSTYPSKTWNSTKSPKKDIFGSFKYIPSLWITDYITVRKIHIISEKNPMSVSDKIYEQFKDIPKHTVIRDSSLLYSKPIKKFFNNITEEINEWLDNSLDDFSLEKEIVCVTGAALTMRGILNKLKDKQHS